MIVVRVGVVIVVMVRVAGVRVWRMAVSVRMAVGMRMIVGVSVRVPVTIVVRMADIARRRRAPAAGVLVTVPR